MSAVMGTFVAIKTMADGTPRMTLDLDCTLADIAALGMIPGTPFGIARISGESTVRSGAESGVDASSAESSVGKGPVERSGQLCIMACNFCKEPAFWKWTGLEGEQACKQYLLDTLGIQSRKEIDGNSNASYLFHGIRNQYMAWRAQQ